MSVQPRRYRGRLLDGNRVTAFDPPYPTGQIVHRLEDLGCVLHLTGEIDAAVVADFERSAVGAPRPVVAVDASWVTFMSSSGVGLLVRLTEQHRQAGNRPVLRHPSRATRSVLVITGVDRLFDTI